MNLLSQSLLTASVFSLAVAANAQGNAASALPIKIGEINSYSSIPQFTIPYKQGWQLAVEEVNAKGGLLGRKVEVIMRDDSGKPEEALRHAVELTSKEKVDVLAGGFFSNIGLALADHAAKNKRIFIASEQLTDAIVWEKGNRYTFRLRPSTYMQAAMLVEEAANCRPSDGPRLRPIMNTAKARLPASKSCSKPNAPMWSLWASSGPPMANWRQAAR